MKKLRFTDLSTTRIPCSICVIWGPRWLRCCATNQKVAGSISTGGIKSFRSHYGSGVDSVSNRNEYQEHFLGVKAAGG